MRCARTAFAGCDIRRLSPLPLCLSLFDERLHAFAHVVGGEKQIEILALEFESVVDRCVERLQHGFLRETNSDRWTSRNLEREFHCRLEIELDRHDTIDKSGAVSFVRRDHASGQHHIHCEGLAHCACQALSTAGARHYAYEYLGLPEARGLRRHYHVAYHHELASSAKCDTRHRSDYRHTNLTDAIPSLELIALEHVDRRCVSHLRDVSTGGKHALASVDDNAPHVAVVVELFERVDELDHQRQVQRVHDFRTIQLHGGDVAFVARDDNMLGHCGDSATVCIRSRRSKNRRRYGETRSLVLPRRIRHLGRVLRHPSNSAMIRSASLLVVAIVLASSLHAQQAAPHHSRVRIHVSSVRDQALVESLDVDHIRSDGDALVAVLTHDDVERLREAGVKFDIVVDELERFYADRAARDLERMRSESPLHKPSQLRNFVLGSVGGYLSIGELDSQLNRMAELYPRLVSAPEQIGTSHQGRPILAVRISARPNSDTAVPEALYTGMHHSREPAGMMSIVYSMWSMLESYGGDREITHLLDTRALWFVPLVNPDGYAFNIANAPTGGGLWRRNMREGGGVDLNRNYGPLEFWDHPVGGSSTNPQSDTYRGPGPFSEPETRAIRDFCLGRRFGIALNHHTFSNLFVQPEEILQLNDADSVYYKLATRALGSLAGYAPGNTKITVGYLTRGSSDDWMFAYGRSAGQHIFSWTPESGNDVDEFWPAPSRIEPICEWNHRLNIGFAWAAAAAPMIVSRAWRPTANGPIVRVTVMNVGRRSMTAQASLQLDEGMPIAVPAMAPGESLPFDLEVPEVWRSTPSVPRASVGITLTYDGVPIRDSIAPIVHRVDTLLAENFESGLARWSTGGEWGSELTDEGNTVASDSPDRDYSERRDPNVLELIRPVSLVGLAAAEMFFDASFAVEARNHNASVQILREPSLIWEDVDAEELQLPLANASLVRNQFRGDQRTWRRYHMKLDDFLGSEVRVRFVVSAFNSPWHYTFDGLKIDDVEFVGAIPITAGADVSVAGTVLVMPNPFTSRLVVQLADSRVPSVIELYDALGSLVRIATTDARATFDTQDLAAGAYTVVIRRGDAAFRQRVVLAR